MDRIAQFENMLEEVQRAYDDKSAALEKMRAEGKEKTSTFKLYMADKLLYARMLSLFEKHGLL